MTSSPPPPTYHVYVYVVIPIPRCAIPCRRVLLGRCFLVLHQISSSFAYLFLTLIFTWPVPVISPPQFYDTIYVSRVNILCIIYSSSVSTVSFYSNVLQSWYGWPITSSVVTYLQQIQMQIQWWQDLRVTAAGFFSLDIWVVVLRRVLVPSRHHG